MKIYHSILILILLSLFPANIFSQNIDKPIYELERNAHSGFFNKLYDNYENDTNINVNYYKLNLYIIYNPDYLIGEVTINSISRVNNLNTIFYDFSNNLTVDSISYKNKLIPFIHSQNVITISFGSSFNTGQLISVKIFYHGVPVPTGFGSFIFGSHNGNEPAIWTLSEPYGSSDWFPCKNIPSDKADSSDVWLRCSNQLTAVSNGLLNEIQNNGDGTLTYKWHNSYPIANYLISLAISNYAQYNFYFKYSLTDSMPVVNYIYPENIKKLEPELDKTNYMLGLFSEKYGPYPFLSEKYGHAEFGRNGGMENQTISSMGAWGDDIIAHELTHQWFGDKITCHNWENIWLNEGFATYGQAIYHEAAEGISSYNEFIKNTMASARTAIGTIYVQDVNNINQIFSGNRTYAKGCIVLHMLRGIVGDSVYFDIMRAYTSDTSFAYKNAVTENFQNVAERVYGQSLNYFFHEWIYGENYPVYNVSWTTQSIGNSQYKASINILQKVNSNPSFFTMPVQIKIITNTGDTSFTVFNNSQSQTFDFILNSKPISYEIDPNNLILKDIYGADVIPVTFSLEQNFPNPFNPKTKILYRLGTPANVQITIYDILGNEIAVIKNDMLREGNYSYEFIGEGLASGVYFYNLEAWDYENINLLFEETKKMILVK